MLSKLFQLLDRYSFLRYRLWEFSWRNVFRLYPWYYLGRVFFRFPRISWKGLCKYHRRIRRTSDSPLMGSVDHATLLESTPRDERFLIAPGFCMKPYDPAGNRSLCPAGHFNHRCLMIENPGILHTSPTQWPPPCSACDIGTLSHYAARIRADVYIMTSTMDVARDISENAVRGTGARRGLFFLCRYTMEAFSWGLMTSGMEGAAIPFSQGDCQNHADFTRADRGQKESQTSVDAALWHDVLNNLKARSTGYPTNNVAYEYRDNVYRVVQR